MSSIQSKSLLEDIRRDLNIDNLIIRNQAFSRLTKFIKSVVLVGSKINEASDNLPCIQLLWECATHDAPFVCDVSCTIWIHLITNRLAEFAYVVNGFVNRILSSNNTKSVLGLRWLTKLLLFQLNWEQKYIYQLNFPVHPFIVIIQQKAELCPAVLSMITFLLRSEKKREAYNSLLPVLKYVLWKSHQSNSIKGFRISLASVLWDCMQDSHSVSFQPFMWKSLFWLKVDCVTSALEVQSEICQWLKNYFQQFQINNLDAANVEDILLCLASCGKKLIEHQVDICESVFYMKLLAERLKNELATDISNASLIIMLQIINLIPESEAASIFKICQLLSFRKGTNLFVNHMLLTKIVIHINNCGQSKSFTSGAEQSMATALQLLIDLERVLEKRLTVPIATVSRHSNLFEAVNFNEITRTVLQMMKLCRHFWKSSENILQWLDDVILSFTYLNNDEFCENFYSLICAIFLQTLNIEILKRCITILVSMANIASFKAPDAFVLIMYKLKSEKNPMGRLLICQTIPSLATTKVCVGPILKSLSAFYEEPSMRPLALRLMCSLWQQQERVYPVLYKWIVEDRQNEKILGINEISLAKAASIFEVCLIKSHVHGSDLLTVLSKLVAFGTSPSDTSTVVLALESIIILCRESVIDLKTTWKFVFPLLKNDKRFLVQIKMCELLSLASEFYESGQDDFLEESLTRLWKFAFEKNHIVAYHAFKGLSKFKKHCHQLKHFPPYIIDGIKNPEKLIPSSNEGKEDGVLTYVPGSCFVDLFITLPSPVISGYGEWMCSLVLHEVREMPRFLLHLSSSSKLMGDQSKEDSKLTQISKLLTESYGSKHFHKFKSSLILGLLFTFDAQVDSGRISRHFVVNKSRSYTEKLEKFLINVSLDISEWRSTLLYSTGWNNFIESLFLSMIETKEIQIEQNNGQDGISNAEGLKMEASLWARDKITEMLKNSARIDPVAHGNAIIALAGLVKAVYKYDNMMTDVTHREGSEYISHRYWTSEVTKVICKCLETETALISGAFTWCCPGSGNVSDKVRHYVALAIPSLSLTLINTEHDVINGLFLQLFDGLDSSSNCELKNFCYGFSLGQLISNLITEYSCEKALFTGVLTKFKDYCFKDDNLKLRFGGIFGFCIAISSYCQVFPEDSQLFVDHILTTLNKDLLNDAPSDEILSIGLVMVMISATSKNIISLESAKELADTWHAKSKQDLKVLPLGLLLNFLSTVDEKYIGIRNELLTQLTNLIYEKNDVSKVTSILHGLLSLTVGLEISFILKQSPVQLKEIESMISLLSYLLTSSNEPNIPNCCFWMLGCLHYKMSQMLGSSNEGPTDYRFLDDQSLLKPLVKCLKSFSKNGIKTDEDKAIAVVCLKCLGLNSLRPYPNLNWDLVLNPLFNSSQEIQKLCVDVVIERASRSVAAKVFATSLITPNTFSSLFDSTQLYLVERLQQMMIFVNPNIMKTFLKMYVTSVFKLNPKEIKQLQFLKGLHQVLQLKEQSQIISSMLYSSLSEIFNWIAPEKRILWNYYCEVVCCLSEYKLEELITYFFNDDQEIYKIAHFQCEIVGNGKLPLNRLNKCIESLANCKLENKSFNQIYKVFLMCFQKATKHCLEIDRLNWILELMGYIQIVAGQNEAESVSKALTILFNIFSCAISSWTGLQVQLFNICIQMEDTEFPVTNLSLSWSYLNKRSLWKSQNRKMVEFLFFLFHCPQTEKCLKIYIKECLFNFRHFEEFQSSPMWIRLLDAVDELRDDPVVCASKTPLTTTSVPLIT